MRALDMVCEVCKAEVDSPCDQKVGVKFIGSYHLERVLAASRKEYAINLAKRQARQKAES